MGGAIRRDDMKQHARLETAIRMHVFETVQFLRKYVPGFDRAYLLIVAPYFGSRGGPHIDGEYTITPEDAFKGARFDDVLYRNTHAAQPPLRRRSIRLRYPLPFAAAQGHGRPAGNRPRLRLHPPRPRPRRHSRPPGAHATRRGRRRRCRPWPCRMASPPAHLDVKRLQRHLLQQGFYLGEPARLVQLGLTDS